MIRSRRYAEGAPVGKSVDRSLRLAVAAAKPIDNLWHDDAGLTKMTFTPNR